jgi:hypothetical protein
MDVSYTSDPIRPEESSHGCPPLNSLTIASLVAVQIISSHPVLSSKTQAKDGTDLGRRDTFFRREVSWFPESIQQQNTKIEIQTSNLASIPDTRSKP